MNMLSSDLCSTFNSFDPKYKPVGNRKNRPTLAMDDKALARLCGAEKILLRYKIALMYWRENKSAREIATDLGMTVEAVKKIIQRLRKKLSRVDAFAGAGYSDPHL